MGVVVQLQSSQDLGVVCNWTDLSFGAGNRQDTSDSVVRGISFHDDRGVRNEVSEDQCSGEGMLQSIERISIVLRESSKEHFSR